MKHRNQLSRRDFLSYTAAGAACLFSPRDLWAAEPPPETTSIRIHDAPIACFAPVFVAGELLKLEGFTNVQYVKTPVNEGPSEAMAKGMVDFIINDPPAHVLAIDEGANMTVLGGIHTGCWELLGSKDIRTLHDLKGKRIAAPNRSSREAFVSAMVASVGLDPKKDIVWVEYEFRKSLEQFAEGKLDAFMGFAPEPQELRSRGIGHTLINTQTDRPWSQYFCCLAAVNTDYVRKYPIATRRALRAYYKATDLCVSDPERAAKIMVKAGVSDKYEYVLQAVREIGYRNWRIYNSEDTMRFWGLRMREMGLVSVSPRKVIEEHCDWRFSNELKKQFKA